MATAATPPRIEMWFDFASPYSHLSLMRLPALADAAGVMVSYTPFLLGPVFRAQGMNDSPIRLFPGRGAYMLRDLQRRAQRSGVAFVPPSEFPRASLLASRIALQARHEPWYLAFCRAVFEQNFVFDRDIQSPDVMAQVLEALGQPVQPWLARAATDAAKQALRDTTEQALARGMFGAPTFFAGAGVGGRDGAVGARDTAGAHIGTTGAQVGPTGDGSPGRGDAVEMFWGDDRLEDAIEWALASSGQARAGIAAGSLAQAARSRGASPGSTGAAAQRTPDGQTS